MHKYYIEQKITDKGFDNKDFVALLLSGFLILVIFYVFQSISHTNNYTKVIDPYYTDKFHKVPSKKSRFANKNYSIAISKIYVNDSIRDLKYKLKDLNHSLDGFKGDLLKQQAMNDIILMLKKVKSGDIEQLDTGKMQQAILEAGYGNVDPHLLKKAIKDYKNKEKHQFALADKIRQEHAKTNDKLKNDSKQAKVLATDIAKEIAENEIESFIETLSIIARVGKFVIDKSSE